MCASTYAQNEFNLYGCCIGGLSVAERLNIKLPLVSRRLSPHDHRQGMETSPLPVDLVCPKSAPYIRMA